MTSILSIVSDYNHFFSIGQIILLVILLYKYEFLKKHAKIKLIIVSLIYIAVTEYSLMTSGISGAGIEVFISLIYFLTFLYILYKAELDKILYEKKLLFDSQMDSIQKEKFELIQEVNKKEARITNLNKLLATQANGKCCLDMDKYKLTNRQKKVVHILARKNLTNKDIAIHFHIKEGTVKSHLYNIYNKIGVSTRNELLGLYYSIDLDI